MTAVAPPGSDPHIEEDRVTRPGPEQRRALFRVVRGAPSDAELAALTVVLAVSSAQRSAPPAGPAGAWNDPTARLRGALPVGPGAWRTSTWPR